MTVSDSQPRTHSLKKKYKFCTVIIVNNLFFFLHYLMRNYLLWIYFLLRYYSFILGMLVNQFISKYIIIILHYLKVSQGHVSSIPTVYS